MVPARESVSLPLGTPLALLRGIGVSTRLTPAFVITIAILRTVLPGHVREYT